jgi:hypothetical protein
MSERFSMDPGEAWTRLNKSELEEIWADFEGRFGFRASVDSAGWPAIHEPRDSLTFDLSVVADGAQRGAAYDAINAEALRCFVWNLADAEVLVALDWQHPGYRFRPAVQALTWAANWAVPVFPDGDYFSFFTPDMTEGTFGHPWEQTLCVIGPRLVDSLGRSLATWLPVKRRNGKPG